LTNQPADVSFVIDQISKMGRAKSGNPLAGLVDKKHIGVAELSLGGGRVYGPLVQQLLSRRAYPGAVLMSALSFPFKDGEATWRHAPALMLHSDADTKWDPISKGRYPLLATPKWFVTLDRSTHSGPFVGHVRPGQQPRARYHRGVLGSIPKGPEAAQARIVDTVRPFGQADLERGVP
jgi:hypothetical protein